MRILIIGGTQFIGKHLASLCAERGHEVVLFNRGVTRPQAQHRTILGDVDQLLEFKTEFLGLRADVVIHCIAYTEKHATDLLSLFQGTHTRVIVLSSVDCYEAFNHLRSGKEESDFPITEFSPTSTERYYWKGTKHVGGDLYDKNLLTDIILRAHDAGLILTTVLRLPMVYGPEDHQYAQRHGSIVRRIYDRRPNMIVSQREQNRIWTFGYVENIAAAILHSLSSDVTIGKIYNLGESSVRSWRRWIGLYSKVSKHHLEVEVLPDEVLKADREYRHNPPQHFIVDTSLFRSETSYSDPVGLEEGIYRTLAWGLNHPDTLGATPDYDREQSIQFKYDQLLGSFL